LPTDQLGWLAALASQVSHSTFGLACRVDRRHIATRTAQRMAQGFFKHPAEVRRL